jgi:DNA helicase HerA-like ATPase
MLGVPVFLADVKGDLAGMINPGADSADMQQRIREIRAGGMQDSPISPIRLSYWDIFGQKGLQLRTTDFRDGPAAARTDTRPE